MTFAGIEAIFVEVVADAGGRHAGQIQHPLNGRGAVASVIVVVAELQRMTIVVVDPDLALGCTVGAAIVADLDPGRRPRRGTGAVAQRRVLKLSA